MSKGLDTLKTIRHIHNTECGKDKSINKDFDIIEKELKKPQELYNLIKQKCANAQWDFNMNSASDPDADIYDLFKLEGQIAAYNDVLSLMESMFEELEDGK